MGSLRWPLLGSASMASLYWFWRPRRRRSLASDASFTGSGVQEGAPSFARARPRAAHTQSGAGDPLPHTHTSAQAHAHERTNAPARTRTHARVAPCPQPGPALLDSVTCPPGYVPLPRPAAAASCAARRLPCPPGYAAQSICHSRVPHIARSRPPPAPGNPPRPHRRPHRRAHASGAACGGLRIPAPPTKLALPLP